MSDATGRQDPDRQPTLLGYAEPSTNRLSLRQWLARKWFFVCLKTFLFIVLAFIGGTVGSLFFDLGPSMPWEQTLEVRSTLSQTLQTHARDVVRIHDLMTPMWSETFLAESGRFSEHPVTASEIQRRVHTSGVRADDSFVITISGKTQDNCAELAGAYGGCLEGYASGRGLSIGVVEGSAQPTDAGKRAPLVNTLTGVGMGLAAAMIIIRVSAVGFRKQTLRSALERVDRDLTSR